MASTPSCSSQLTQIKTKLKTWERQFKTMEGRAPSKADIKANPEIAKMYSAYNSSRKVLRGSDDLPNASPPCLNNHLQAPSTPKSKTRLGSSKAGARNPSQENFNILPSKNYAHVNSPSKIKKLVEDHSPRKAHYDRLRQSQNKSTPSQLRQNPFDFDSGGKGSPALFADLLLESKRDTPRTKARKYIEGIGSPLKPKLNPLEHSRCGSQSAGSGLSSFLKSQPIQSQEKSSHAVTSDTFNDKDDEILGPSPFKPLSTNVFQPLFDEPEAEPDDHLLSPSKMIKSKWKITSATPFISQPQTDASGVSSSNLAPQCAQRDPDQSEKKKSFGFGTKRKRLIPPREENSSFYQDLPDPNTNNSWKSQSSIILNKKKRIEQADNKTLRNNQNKKTGERKTTTTKAQLLTRKAKTNPTQPIQDPLRELVGDQSEESADERMVLPNLPFGNPNQSAVCTALKTFTFTISGKTSNGARGKNMTTENRAQVAEDKGKGKGVAGALGEPDLKPVKSGTRNFVVRAYQPIELSQISTNIHPDLLDISFDGLDESKEMLEEEEDPAGESEEVDDFQLSDNDDEDLEDTQEEEDPGISEELLNILNDEDRLVNKGEERRQLLRERRQDRKVRKILDGMTLMEKTLANPKSTNIGGSITSLGGGQGKKPLTYKKPAGRGKQQLLRLPVKEDSTEEDLQFELALGDLDLDQQLDAEVVDLEDEWDDEPAGWKNELLSPDINNDDTDFLDNQFVL